MERFFSRRSFRMERSRSMESGVGPAGLAAGSGGQEEVAIGMLVEVAGELQEVGGGIVEAPRGIWQGEPVNAEGAEGFVLAVVRVAVLEEDGGEVGEVLHLNRRN